MSSAITVENYGKSVEIESNWQVGEKKLAAVIDVMEGCPMKYST